jgi:AcrR family transcriptional regulator
VAGNGLVSGIHGPELNVVHTLNVVHLRVVPDDRRERTRQAKRARILAAAGGVIDQLGLDGLTMQAVATELDCAVGTLYTAFASKAELLAVLQGEGVGMLEASLRTAQATWEAPLAELEPEMAALVELVAYGGFVTAAAVVYPDETRLVRAMLGDAAPPKGSEEARALLPVVLRLLDPPVGRLADAVGVGVLHPGDPVARGLAWLAALHGVLRLDALGPLDRHLFRSGPLARSLTEDLLCGWGAPRDDIEVAASHLDRLAALGPLAPPPGAPQ